VKTYSSIYSTVCSDS